VILFTLVLDNTGENWEIKMLSACTAIVSLSLAKYLFSAELKGLCHEMKKIFEAYYNKLVLSVHALMVLTIFCFLVDEKMKLKVLACSFEITYKF
jgi:hypothetical protein